MESDLFRQEDALRRAAFFISPSLSFVSGRGSANGFAAINKARKRNDSPLEGEGSEEVQ